MESARSGFDFRLNGELVRVSDIPPQTTLLDFVRGRGLTGSKEGCAEGECGACAVLFVKSGPNGTRYSSVNSCLVPLPMAAGQEILTVEGLAANGELAPMQKAMAEFGGSQCGYCTPGFVVSMFAEHYRRDSRSTDPHSLGGNLCRCTGYRPIRDALLSVSPPEPGPHLARLDRAAPEVTALSYATDHGKFSRPRTLGECLELLYNDPQARLVGGNTDLGVMTNLRDERFPHLLSVEALAELRQFRDGAESIEIGAALTLTEIGELWIDSPEVFREWLGLFASPLIRNRATLGGNLATASPIGDSAPLLLALNAQVSIAAMAGERTIPLAEFFRGYRQTALGPGELIRCLVIPKPLPSEVKFYKVAKRVADDISSVAAGIAVSRNADGRIVSARIGLGGVGPTPVRALEAEAALTGSYGDENDFESAAGLIARSISPMSDHRGSAAYRSAMAASLLRKFFAETAEQPELVR